MLHRDMKIFQFKYFLIKVFFESDIFTKQLFATENKFRNLMQKFKLALMVLTTLIHALSSTVFHVFLVKNFQLNTHSY